VSLATVTRYLHALARDGILTRSRWARENCCINHELKNFQFKMPAFNVTPVSNP